jgi:gamma-glutamyltranspeptidase
MVASPHHLATEAGVSILRRGGNAVDAMVAVNAALGVLYPHMTGAGGDAFWLIHDAGTATQHVLNASGRAAALATRERYAGGIPRRGPAAALTVPGAVDGWVQAAKRFGRLHLRESLAPAVEYARQGAPVAPGLARWSAASAELLRSFDGARAAYLDPGGGPLHAGQTLRLPRLAETLEAIGEGGRAAFYEGPIARRLVDALAAGGGVLGLDDLAGHRSDWVAPLRVDYRGRIATNLPPNSQGFAALEILGVLDRFDLAALAGDPAATVDLVVRATALAFEDRDRYLTDPAFSDVPVDRLLGAAHLEELAGRVAEGSGPPSPTPAPVGGDTTFSCAVDAEGNAAGVIQSLFFEWGSGMVAGDTGILLQNRGCSFTLDPTHPNRLEPGKRTFHTLSAAMLLGPDGGPELVYGAMGGEGQPQTQAALVIRIVDQRLTVQDAVDAPRWLLGRTWGEAHRGLRLEGRFGPAVAAELIRRGHTNVELVDDWSDLMGHAQAILATPEGLEGAADPRADGAAIGL